ncbi:hypothetical protein BDQ12DRAFT_713748 [Crucibulum laeve]|uniref:Uncharacterized protein n=1 Tax=Crucibulum laeve TaxID=68775 RepID=A0A5C3LVC6_9AGAR|nr:hypothetical protein BDQ12DRAFT_713748 [Crucibulum laeve]
MTVVSIYAVKSVSAHIIIIMRSWRSPFILLVNLNIPRSFTYDSTSAHGQITTIPETFNAMDPAEAKTLQPVLLMVIIAALVEILLYGIHVALFIICTHILLKNRSSSRLLILASAVTMFALSTADIALTFRSTTQFFLNFEYAKFTNVIYLKMPIFVASNFIADIVLACISQRLFCGLVGVFNKNDVFYIQGKFSPVFLWTIFGINIIVTVATAGRIYWIARMVEPLAGRPHVKAYQTTVAIVIESGVIYSISVLFFAVYYLSNYMFIVAVCCMRLVGIMPTLLIVRVWLEHNSDIKNYTCPTIVSTVNFRHEGSHESTSVVLDTIIETEEKLTHELPASKFRQGSPEIAQYPMIKRISLMTGSNGFPVDASDIYPNMDTQVTDTLPLQIFIIAALIEILLYVAMFALSTADIAISFHAMTRNVAFLLGFDYVAFMDALYPKMPIFVANKPLLIIKGSFVADVVLLYRCYMVWGQRKYVIILSSILILVDTVWGWIGVFNKDNIFHLRGKYSPVYLWTVFGINIIMTAATASRIYWVAHTAQPIAGGVHMKAYRTAMAILVESGAIYSISVLLFVLYSSTIYMYYSLVYPSSFLYATCGHHAYGSYSSSLAGPRRRSSVLRHFKYIHQFSGATTSYFRSFSPLSVITVIS